MVWAPKEWELFSNNISGGSLITNCPFIKQTFYSFTLLRMRENGIDVNKQIRSSSYR